MTLFQNLILFTNRYGNLQEMLEMASFLKYVDLYLTSGAGFTWDILYDLFHKAIIASLPFLTYASLFGLCHFLPYYRT
jgi:hypothetical protein